MPPKSKKNKKGNPRQQQHSNTASSGTSQASSSNGSTSLLPQQSAAESYQHAGLSQSPRTIERPTIRNYSEQIESDIRSFFVMGDASLRPNVGLTNRYDGALFGMALHELLEQLRMANIICALASIILLLMSWLLRLIIFQMDKLMLSIYLAILSLVLLLTECMSLYSIQWMDTWLKNNFGLLRHPLGKAIYVFLLSTICFGIADYPEGAVGIVYLGSSVILLYSWCAYPELRSSFEDLPQVDDDFGATLDSTPSVNWSFYGTASPFGKWEKRSGEKASLLES